MDEYTYENKTYYAIKDLQKISSPCVSGANKGVINFLKNKGLEQNKDYLFVQAIDEESFDIKESYSRRYGMILVSKDYVDSFIPKKVAHMPKLPPLLELDDNEKFRDCKGNVYEIEVRGERCYDKCFFKASDVARVFKLPNLISVINDSDSSYTKQLDYEHFNSIDSGTIISKSANRDQTTYLTYYGLIRAIIVSRTGTAKQFTDWMMKTLFTVHLGTREQKMQLSSKLIGVDYKTVVSFCSALNTKISAIYLFRIGSVKELRSTLSIPKNWCNNASVYKYGRTNDIKRRFKNHLDGKYSKENGFNTSLITMWFIDKSQLIKAENDLKDYLITNKNKLNNDYHTEIAIFENTKKMVVDDLNVIFNNYASEIDKVNERVTNLEHENNLLRKDIKYLSLKLKASKKENRLLRRLCS